MPIGVQSPFEDFWSPWMFRFGRSPRIPEDSQSSTTGTGVARSPDFRFRSCSVRMKRRSSSSRSRMPDVVRVIGRTGPWIDDRAVCHAWPALGTSMPPSAPPNIPLRCAPGLSPFRRSSSTPSISTHVEIDAFPSAPRAPKNPRFTPARKNRARISHVSIFQNMGSARATPQKSPRNPTLDSPSPAREFPTFSRVHTPAVRFRDPFLRSQNTSEIKTGASHNPFANTAQQTPVR